MKYDSKFSSSLAANMAKHLSDNQEYSSEIKDAKVGDYIFWTGKSDAALKNVDHVGVITKMENGIITVASAEVSGARNKKPIIDPNTGKQKIDPKTNKPMFKTVPWEGGTKSFKETKLSLDGSIWQKRDGTGGKKIVGVGRTKE